MNNRTGIKLTAVLMLMVFWFNSWIGVAWGKTWNKQPAAANYLKLPVQQNAEILFVDNNYVIIKERQAGSKYKITVMDKRYAKIIKTYSLAFAGYGWDSWSNPGAGRYILVRQAGGNYYYNYLVDILTGVSKALPKTSLDSELTGGPSAKGVVIRDGEVTSILNIKTGEFVKLGEERVKTFGWDRNGDYFGYIKDGLLQIFNVSTMQPVTIAGREGKELSFAEWTSDGKGILYEADGLLKVYKLSGSTKVLGEFNPVPEGQFLMPDPVQWNPQKTKAAIQDMSDKIYIYDVTGDVYGTVYKPQPDFDTKFGAGLMDVFWSPDGADIKFLSYRNLGKMQYTNGNVYLYDKDGLYEELKLKSSKDFTFYKNYLLFLTDIEMMGTADVFAHKLAVYDLQKRQLHLIDKVGRFEVTPDKQKVLLYKEYPADSGPVYLLDEQNWKLGKPVPGLTWNWGLFVNGKRIIISPGKSNTRSISAFDSNKSKNINLLTVRNNEQFYLTYGKNIVLIYVPGRQKVYFYNGLKLWSINVKGQIVGNYGHFQAPQLALGEKEYYYLERVKGKTYFRMAKIKP